jgi:hypothetical protein
MLRPERQRRPGGHDRPRARQRLELLSAAAGALSTSFRPIALDVLLAVCRRLGMPQPVLPPHQSNARD